ncbi:hypothetical protein Q9Q94_02725 [Uliginosibacterium sp. 31-16]|uniref:hypothetical protein n=1 Tax=Uliginosibacterium sp. 31-16 TaxID=3068315 RepID=UPI00273F292A|nr:hypothetical protein [Uliginosibacterium sp. 31-16]MDP5238423.1 hypothetical protein [Uliginosibacterium sp. 31-16]
MAVEPAEAEIPELPPFAAQYREACRAVGSPAALDARVLAAARVHSDRRLAAREHSRRQRFWRIGGAWLAVSGLLLVVMNVSGLRGQTGADANLLQPASLSEPAVQGDVSPLPVLQVPAQAPASTQATDPCRLRVTPETASAQALQDEIARLGQAGCAATLAGLPGVAPR